MRPRIRMICSAATFAGTKLFRFCGHSPIEKKGPTVCDAVGTKGERLLIGFPSESLAGRAARYRTGSPKRSRQLSAPSRKRKSVVVLRVHQPGSYKSDQTPG